MRWFEVALHDRRELQVGWLIVGGATTGSKNAKARAPDKKDRRAGRMGSCKSKCALAKTTAAKRNQAFDGSQCYLECLADEPRDAR